MTTDATGTHRSDAGDERWYLTDEREFLLRSIGDAELELRAGDLSEDDYAVLIGRDRRRLAEVEAELASLGPAAPDVATPESPDAPERSRRTRWRRAGIIASCLLIAAGAVILVDHALSPGIPGQASSGSITQPKAQLIEEQLAQALTLNNEGEAVTALQLYDKVLFEDPEDPEALAASGWLEWNYGSAGDSKTLMQAGRRAEEKAIHLARTFYAAHLFLGLILLNQDHNASGAVKQFNSFLADSPPKAEVASVAPLVASAYEQAKDPVPAAIASTTTSTTTSGASTSAP